MIGKVNYNPASLVQLESKSQLPKSGSETAIYYVREEDKFYTYNKSTKKYNTLETRKTTWQITSNELLNNLIGGKTKIKITNVSSIGTDNARLSIGDIIYDLNGTQGIISLVDNKEIEIETLDSMVSRRVTYSDNSWEMWLSKSEGCGHYYWDISTNILSYEGMNQDQDSPIVWEAYSIIGGAANYIITGGDRIGTRRILAWDSKFPGTGTIKMYYTKGNNDDSYDESNEIATMGDIHKFLESKAGIYCGSSNTLTRLNLGEINGFPTDHTLSNNDWVYVLHYDENIKQYQTGVQYSGNDIIEYEGLLYKASENFTSISFSDDQQFLESWDGDSWSFIYNKKTGWTRGAKLDSDNYEPDEKKLTKTTNNKMTIKDGGVTTSSLEDQSVTTNKINDSAVTTDKIADHHITKEKLDTELTKVVEKVDRSWTTDNLIISPTQPSVPASGYIVWINSNPDSI